MGRYLDHPIAEPRNRHLQLVAQRPRINPKHPSVQAKLFDQADPEVHAADRCVLLTQIEAQLIASLLKSARAHLPSPKAVDEAVAILMGKAS